MTSKENLIAYKSRQMENEKDIITLNLEKELRVPTDRRKFTQLLAKTNGLEKPVRPAHPSAPEKSANTRAFSGHLKEKYSARFAGGRRGTFHPDVTELTRVDIVQEAEKTDLISPFSARKVETLLNGNDPQPEQAESHITTIFENSNEKTTTKDVEMKVKHNFTPSPGCNSTQEVMESREEVSRLVSMSDCTTHQVEPEKYREAFNQTYGKAECYMFSTICAPSWLHKFIIGKKGQNISKISEVVPKVHIDFTAEGKIHLEGRKDDVSYAQEQIEVIVKRLFSQMDDAEISIDYIFHKYLTEKDGAVMNRIRQRNDVSVLILPGREQNHLVRIEGEAAQVQQAKRELLELAATLQEERTIELRIEQRFHDQIIGKKGERLHNIRKTFPKVTIIFPDSGEKSDIVQLRGPKHELEKCSEYLDGVVADIVENSHAITIPLFKQFHRMLICNGAENIKKICSESNTKIGFPSVSSTSENIVITGKPENCEVARQMILSIQKDIANICQVELCISSTLHKSLVDPKECLIGSILRECGKIHITFPRKDSGLQKVIIRGPAEGVEKAQRKLLELAEEKQAKGCSVALRVKPQYHQFLRSKACGPVSKFCDGTGALAIFPTLEDRDQEVLSITGTVEAVSDARKELEALIEDLQNVVECAVFIKRKHHPHFTREGAQLLREISEEYGGVSINFPSSRKRSKRVIIKGAKPCVEAAKERIVEIIGDLEAKVTTECIIPQKFHGFLMGPMCSRIQEISREYDVQINFPDGETESSIVTVDPAAQENGKEIVEKSSEEPASPLPRKCDTVLISGRKENCEAAMKAIESLVPDTDEVQAPPDLHCLIFGQSTSRICKITDESDVQIQAPEPGLRSAITSVRVPAVNVEEATASLQKRVKALHTETEDWALGNFKLMMTVDPKYHPKIIGHKGLVVAQICLQHKVTIHLPDKESSEIQDQIIITGYRSNTLAAQDAIMKIVNKMEATVTRIIPINRSVHGHIIGFQGKSIQKIMNQHQVYIHFPPQGSCNPNVTVKGLFENVKKAVDHILNLERHFLSLIRRLESQQKIIKSASVAKKSIAPAKNLAKRDGPCNANNTKVNQKQKQQKNSQKTLM